MKNVYALLTKVLRTDVPGKKKRGRPCNTYSNEYAASGKFKMIPIIFKLCSEFSRGFQIMENRMAFVTRQEANTHGSCIYSRRNLAGYSVGKFYIMRKANSEHIIIHN